MKWPLVLALLLAPLLACAQAAAPHPPASAASAAPEAQEPGMPQGLENVRAVANLGQCVAKASEFHRVNAQILAAILRHESRLRPDAVRANSNGSLDVGIAQVNSVHWADLARFGIGPRDLLNPCVSTFVAGWQLSRQMARFGNTWYAVGAYHSRTPLNNLRYQVGIWNELVDMGAIGGPKLRAP